MSSIIQLVSFLQKQPKYSGAWGGTAAGGKIAYFTRRTIMPDPTVFVDTSITCPSADSIQANAVIIQGTTHNGKPCRIVDNTHSVKPEELQEVLDILIREKRFGLSGLSAKGGNSISLNTPLSSHIQFGDKLYRLLLFSYEAHVEPF